MANLLNYTTSDAIPALRYGTVMPTTWEALVLVRFGKTTGYDYAAFVGGGTLLGEGQLFPQGQYAFYSDMQVYITEIDFGPTPTYDANFTIADSNVTTSTFVMPWQAGIAATGRNLDEDEMDKFDMVAEAGTGQFILKVHSDHPVAGKYKIGYQIGLL